MTHEILTTPPVGFKPMKGATCHPRGTQWYNNGKSIFDKEYKRVLIIVDKEVYEKDIHL